MGWEKICVSIIVGIVSSFFYTQDRAFSSDVYFTSQEIKGQILHAIEGCRESIDIAVLDITSKDILNALVQAQERGVHVRIVVDRKRALTKGPLSDLYKNKNFAIKALIQKGRMHNNFAIFDSKLLATGSYSWNEDAGRFNRYNVIFTDETRLLVKHQKEFDRLFYEGITAGTKAGVSAAEKEGEKIAGIPSVIIPGVPKEGNQVVASNYGFVITETPDGYINMSFEEFNNIFGVASELSDEQKESLWSRCVGKRVKWNGRVTYIGWGLITGWMMSVSHGDTSVEIKLNSAHKERFSGVKYGSTVTYTGKLDSRVTRIFPYKLEDGDVLEIKNTLSPPSSTNELFENPDVVPVSQGPKKIFLVESFEDLDKIFGKGSNLSDAQKDEAWEKYKGKYVSWMGQIVHKNLNVASGLRVMMKQKESGDVELKFGLAKKEKVLKFHDGETILYTGKLVERCGILSPYILDDGDIITLKELNIVPSGM
ncbi:MAG: phospholipase D-like domain-containing protein [Candidatus Brocadia sp.]